MKAVDPVIATLVLIAIAVIAGVFILRQFLTMTNVGSQQVIHIQDATFYLTRTSNGTNISIVLTISVKNQADRTVTITRVRVPDASWEQPLPTEVRLSPGEVWTKSFVVIDNGSYRSYWETGTQHIVEVYYKVVGQIDEQSASIKGTVVGG